MANKYSKDHKKLIKADLTQEIINVDDGVQIIHKEAFDDANAVEVMSSRKSAPNTYLAKRVIITS